MLIVWALFLCYLNTHVLGDDDDDDNDDDGNGFSFPNATDPEDANLVFTMGNTMDIEWDSPFDNVDLGFVAQGSSTFISLIRKQWIIPKLDAKSCFQLRSYANASIY